MPTNAPFLLLLVLINNIYEKCESAAVTTVLDRPTRSNIWSVNCTADDLDDETETYCIPISHCQHLRTTLTEANIRGRYCGPSNENKDDPRVCCEKNSIHLDEVSTAASCGLQKVQTGTRILGGDDTETGEFPWLARVLRRDSHGTNFACTGMLISSRFVLTAAHCLVSPTLTVLGSLYAVSLGEHKTDCTRNSSYQDKECVQNSKTSMISHFVAHSLYNSQNHDNDIGLITMEDQINFTDYISPICLLERGVNSLEYYVSGWGRTEHGNLSESKRKTVLKPHSWTQCLAKYRTIMVEITRRQICVGGEQGKDTCQGDSGGPLMVQINDTWYAAGVVSFGYKCGRQGWPGIYADLPHYIEWIKNHTRL